MSYHQPSQYYDRIYEIRPYAETVISTEFTYPKLTEYGVEQAYNTATLTYFNTSVKRLYKINDGEWKEYKNPIKLQLGETIYAKGIDKNGIETKVTSYKSTIKSDALGTQAYDGNESTYHKLAFKDTVYLDVDESMQGKKYYINLYVDWTGSPGNISYYNKEGTVISKISTTASGTFLIPEGTVRMSYHQPNNYYDKIYEIRPYTETSSLRANESAPKVDTNQTTEIKQTVTPPNIEVSNSDIYTISKVINITYDEGYTNEYSYDAKNWQAYKEPITINKNVTIYARSMKDNDVVATSSYKITKIDTESGDVSLDDIPTEIEKGSEYAIPSSYSFNNISGGYVKCYDNGIEINNTKDLKVGNHDIFCSASTNAGITISIKKTISVKEINANNTDNINNESKTEESTAGEEQSTTTDENNSNKGDSNNEQATEKSQTAEEQQDEDTEEVKE